MNRKRAILLFLRDVGTEARAKPLPTGRGAADYRALNRWIARTVGAWSGELDADLVVTAGAATGTQRIVQRGRDFGERITNAVADCYALGYEQVVVLGNDCPELTRHDIAEAFAALERGASIAAAPAHDGGAWLVGVNAALLDTEQFRSLPWCTPQLFEALVAPADALAVAQLRHDFDTWHSPEGRHALARLLGRTYRPDHTPSIQSYTPSTATRKALTRLWLPAPPLTA